LNSVLAEKWRKKIMRNNETRSSSPYRKIPISDISEQTIFL
jgi:hypothetical protein